MMKKQFVGTTSSLVTPFAGNGDIDYPSLEKLLKVQTDAGIENILIGGTTGESHSLELEELKAMAAFAVEKTQKHETKVLVGVGTNSTTYSLEQVEQLNELDIDGFVFYSPYHNQPTQEGVIRHFKAMASATDKPILIFNKQKRTGVKIEISTFVKLAKDVRNICGAKCAEKDTFYILDLIRETPSDFTVLAGSGSMHLTLIALGGDGMVSVAANAFPKQTKNITDLCLSGQWEQALKAYNHFQPLIEGCIIETNPIPIKMAASWMHIVRDDFRGPLTKMTVENQEIWRPIVEKFAEKERDF